MSKLSKPVIITRPDGTEVEYPSGAKASHHEPISQSNVSELCRGVKKQHSGFKARFKMVDLTSSANMTALIVQNSDAN